MTQIELNDIAMGVAEAGKLWGLNQMYVKNLCAMGKVKAIKVGKTWVIDKRQGNPKTYKLKGDK